MDFDALLATATNFIEDMGRDAVLRTIDGTSQMPVTVLMSNTAAERDGSLIMRDDKRAIIAAKSGVAPDPELHRLLLDGKSYRIVTVRPLKPSTTVLYFDCQVRL